MSEEWPGAAQWVPPRPSLSALREAVQDCRGCELYRDATQAHEDQEDQEGEPFVGPAGKAVYGSSFRVGDARGRITRWPEELEVDRPPAWVLPTTHPSAVLRADDREAAYEGLVADLAVAARELG